MTLRDTGRLALRNLSQARLRTALTVLGVAIGVGALTCMMSLGVGLQEQLVGRFLKSGLFDTINVLPQNSFPGRGRRAARKATARPAQADKPAVPLDDDAIARMAALEGVREVYPNYRVPVEIALGERAEFAMASGVPFSAKGEGVFQNITHGAFFATESEDTCILGLEFAHRLTDDAPQSLVGREVTISYAAPSASPQPGPMGLPGGLNLQRVQRPFRIVGILEREPGPSFGGPLSAVMVPLGRAREMAAVDVGNPQAILQQLAEKRTYVSVTVRARSPKETEDVERRIKEMGFSAFSIADALRQAKKAFLILDLLLGLTGSVALSVAALGIVNTMVMSILERTREIGIMKAIGGDDADIRRIFLVEASGIGLAGGLLGVFLGWGAGRLINFGANVYIQSQGGTPESVFFIPWWLVAGAVLFSIVVSLAAGSYPAARAARLDPIRALRHD